MSRIRVEVLLLIPYTRLIGFSYKSIQLLPAYNELSLKFSQTQKQIIFFSSKIIKSRLRIIKKFANEQPNTNFLTQIPNQVLFL